VYDVPDGYEVVAIVPPRVELTLHGRRRDLVLLEDEDIAVSVQAQSHGGRRSHVVDPKQLSPPPGVEVVAIKPRSVQIELRKPKSGGR
jgi:hypothetical protein